jgi:hypothetical protein
MCPTDAYYYCGLPGGCGGSIKVPRHGDSLFIEMPLVPTGQPLTFTFVREGR